ncbi:MAG: NAD(P)-dependent glycerol-3-phosphate dehydrogenase [Methylophilaceae bacterium]|nr:NAD(P)-dependent glycerol-3-phosphate dehydrogenase [Methylophilaceae bacterium]
MTHIAVLGAGAWGTALAIHLSKRYPVTLWARNAGHVSGMQKARANPLYLGDFKFHRQLQVSNDLTTTLAKAKFTFFVVPSPGFRPLLRQAKALGYTGPIVWAQKGLEPETAKLPFEVMEEEFGATCSWGVLSGPSFAAELVRGLPTAVTLASQDIAFLESVSPLIHGDNLRVYSSSDVVGVVVGGALKNVMAIATGISDGLGFGNNARAALITRGLAEMARFGMKLGADPKTFMGLAGAGDLMLTCTGQYSRNREVGLQLSQGRPLMDILQKLGHVAEGVNTAQEVMRRAKLLEVDMPITREVYAVISQNKDVKVATMDLLGRQQTVEQV